MAAEIAKQEGKKAARDAQAVHEPEQQSVRHSGGAAVQQVTHHYDNSINMGDVTAADPSALQQQIKAEQMSRYYTTTGGLPTSGIGSP
jgi:hypothetical protein